MNHILKYCLAAMVLALGGGVQAQSVPSKNVTPPKPPMWIEPKDPAVVTRASIPLKIHATDPADRDVTWKINNDPGDKSLGAVDASTELYTAVYTAPDSVPDNPPKITATSKVNPKHSVSVSIVVNASTCPSAATPNAGCVSLQPSTTMIRVGREVKLSAETVNLPGAAITWQVTVDDKKDDNGGTISGQGKNVSYKAPPAVPSGKVEVKATTGEKESSPKAVAEMIVVAPYISAHCAAAQTGGQSTGCAVTNFNRTKRKPGTDKTGMYGNSFVDDNTPAAPIAAISASKALSTGSVLEITFPDGVTAANCKNYDWKIVTQTEESPNILIYNPSDVESGICTAAKFLIALPVRVLWADVSGFPQLSDPQRTAPADFATFKDCWGQTAPQTIAPCDRNERIMKSIYKSTWVYTHFGQAGSAQGTISLSPVIGTGERQLSFDVQADPALKVGYGWINIPLVFEKSTTQGSNLDALIVGLAYDIRALGDPNFKRYSHFILRKPQFQVRSSVEIAPTSPHDKNIVEAGTIKLPLVFNFHQQPSAFTAYPVIGVEGGAHFDTHLPEEDEAILRGIAGVDGSFRWPFNVTHNFLGSSPITFEYSYRMRWLAYEEPYTDVANNGPEVLAGGRRSFLRGSFIVPVTPNLQFQVTALRGSLPPDFRALGNTLVIGLTFANPGSSEH